MNKQQTRQSDIQLVISRFYMWWIRTFKVISNQKAKELGLRHWRGVYGDEINRRNSKGTN